MENAILNSEGSLRLLFDTMKNGFAFHEIITDGDGNPVDYRFIDANKAFESQTGLRRDAFIGKTVKEVMPGIESSWIEKYGRVALKGETISFEQYSSSLDKYYEVVAYCPKPGFFAVLFNDTSEMLSAAKDLKTERDFIRHLMEIIPIGIAVMNPEGKITFCNNRAEEILEMKADQISNMHYNSAEWQHSDFDGNKISFEQLPFCLALSSKTTVKEVRHAIFNKEGKRKYLSVNASPILDENNNVTAVITSFEDISQQYSNEKIIADSLLEKETLLKEIHHRVKNNFQVISSLINLQLIKKGSNLPEALLSETKNRIKAMALVHEKLYLTKSLSSIDFSEYLKSLVRDVELNMRLNAAKPRIQFSLTPVLLDIERAVPCGLIVNEIITNIFKYAFPAEFESTPIVRIELTHDKDTVLFISDNGIGIKDETIFTSSETLGISLIGMLAKQINAKLEYSGLNGVSYKITLE